MSEQKTEEKKTKGWRGLVEEAMTKVVRDEITAQIEKRFPPVQVQEKGLYGSTRTVRGISYEMDQYIKSEYASILAKDPEIQAILKEELKKALLEAFASKPKE